MRIGLRTKVVFFIAFQNKEKETHSAPKWGFAYFFLGFQTNLVNIQEYTNSTVIKLK